MPPFFEKQMDYIFFFYGLAFLIVAMACFTIREGEKRLPWTYLGAFGVAHGVNEWMDMLAMALADSPVFSALRFVVMATSFLFLVDCPGIDL